MTLVPALLLAALAASPSPAPSAEPASPPSAAPSPTPAPAPAPTAVAKARAGRPALPKGSLPTVEGEVVEIDHRAHRLRIRASSGDLLLSFDRDTFVRAPAGAATPLQITPGAKVRVGRDGDARAAWVELGADSSTPKPTP